MYCIIILVIIIIAICLYNNKNNLITTKSNGILIYQDCNNHWEILGAIFDYCNKHGIIPDLYTTNTDNNNWLDVYKSIYQYNHIDEINKKYKYTIVPTLDSFRFPWFKPTWVINKINNLGDNTIYFIHRPKSIRKEKTKTPNIKYIHFFISEYKENLLIPTIPLITYKITKPIIVLIGRQDKSTVRRLKLIQNLRDFMVISINRKSNSKELNNIVDKHYTNLDAQKMIDICANSSHITWLTEHNGIQSGCVNMAFSTGCQLLTTPSYKRDFNLVSPIVIDEQPVIIPIQPDLRLVYMERDRIIADRDRLFTRLIDLT